MGNQTTSEPRTWIIHGRRYFGNMKKSIPTEIKIDDKSVHVKIKYKTKTDYDFQVVNGEKELVATEKAVDSEVHVFGRTDVCDMQVAQKLLWFTMDYIMLAIVAVAALFTMGLFLLVGAFYVLFFVRCRHFVISLRTGEEVRIPLSYLDTTQEELDEIKQAILSPHAMPSPGTAQAAGAAGRSSSAMGTNIGAQAQATAQASARSPQANNAAASSQAAAESPQVSSAAATPQGNAIPPQPLGGSDAGRSEGRKFCVFCGQEMQKDWACCPVCGKKAPTISQTLPQDTAAPTKPDASQAQPDSPQAQPNATQEQPASPQTQQNAPQEQPSPSEEQPEPSMPQAADREAEYEMTGQMGGFIASSQTYFTKITVKGKDISVNTRRKNSATTARWERFTRPEIISVSFKRRLCWSIWDLLLPPVALAVLSIVMTVIAFDKLFDATLTLLPVAVVIVAWAAYMLFASTAKKLVITLYNGNTIEIPIDTPTDAKPFLDGIEYPCSIPTLRSNSQFYKVRWRSGKRRMAIGGIAAALVLSLGGAYGIYLVDSLLCVQTWEVTNDGKDVEIQDFVERYCGEDGHWSARRCKVKEDGDMFKKGDVCIEVAYSVSDDEIGDTEIRFLYGAHPDGEVERIYDVTYIKLFDIKCEKNEIDGMFFHMREMYDIKEMYNKR